MAAAQTSHWLAQVLPTVKLVSQNIERTRGVSGSGVGVLAPQFSADPPPPAMSLVTADGAILLQGGYKGQAVVLVPSFEKGKASWRCVGGSKHDTLACEHWHP